MLILAVAVPGVVVGMTGSASLHFRLGRSHADVAKRPDIVILQTDDQTVEQLAAMPHVKELIADKGTTYSRYFTPFPLCCPSRASLLTGMYSHNTGVEGNKPPEGGYAMFRQGETLPVWLQRAGYTTGHFGKYLNGYGHGAQREIPLGWKEWWSSPFPYQHDYLHYRMNVNGTLVWHGTGPTDHVDDVYTEGALDFLKRHAAEDAPFFLEVDYLAPHEATGNQPGRCGLSAIPAARDLGHFADLPLPDNPSLNEADVSDKPAFVKWHPLLTPRQLGLLTTDYQCRRESLLAVDESVKRIVDALGAAGRLDNTYVVFISDNGYMQGEHRVMFGKRRAYDASSRVPFLIRGPGIEAGRVLDSPVANIDMAPTLLEAAGATAEVPERFLLDGHSLLPQLTGHPREEPQFGDDRAILLEIPKGYAAAPGYFGVRTKRYAYIEYLTGDRELYDFDTDPYELESKHADPAYAGVRAALEPVLEVLRACVGPTCEQSVRPPEPGVLPPLARGQVP